MMISSVCLTCENSFVAEVLRGPVQERCDHCRALRRNQQNVVHQADYKRGVILRDLPEMHPEGPGIVYVATSEWMPGILKIGATRRISAQERLRSTAIPHPKIEDTWRELAPWRAEKWLHAYLDEFRIGKTEWFQTTPEVVRGVVGGILLNPFRA